MTCPLGDGFLDTGVYMCIRSRSQSPPLYARDARARLRARGVLGAKLFVLYPMHPDVGFPTSGALGRAWGAQGKARKGPRSCEAPSVATEEQDFLRQNTPKAPARAGWVTSADHGVPRKKMSCTQNVLAQERAGMQNTTKHGAELTFGLVRQSPVGSQSNQMCYEVGGRVHENSLIE
jgi:hypothetical protein